MNEFITRWKSKSPTFFKKIKVYALIVGGHCAAVISANSVIGLSLHPTIITVLGYIVAACVGIVGTAKLTKEDPQ